MGRCSIADRKSLPSYGHQPFGLYLKEPQSKKLEGWKQFNDLPYLILFHCVSQSCQIYEPSQGITLKSTDAPQNRGHASSSIAQGIYLDVYKCSMHK